MERRSVGAWGPRKDVEQNERKEAASARSEQHDSEHAEWSEPWSEWPRTECPKLLSLVARNSRASSKSAFVATADVTGGAGAGAVLQAGRSHPPKRWRRDVRGAEDATWVPADSGDTRPPPPALNRGNTCQAGGILHPRAARHRYACTPCPSTP